MLTTKFLKLDVKFPYPDTEGLRLTFDIEIMSHVSEEIKIWDIEGSVYVSSALHPKRYYIGRAKSITPLSIPPKGSVITGISLDLTYEKLEKIEKIRAGGKLRFEITPSILLTTRLRQPIKIEPVGGPQEYIPIVQYNDGSSLYLIKYISLVVDARSGSSLIEIGVDEWLEILSKLGFKYVRIIEIPMIKQVSNKHLENSLDHLDRAMKLMFENIEESLNACRKALEELREYLKDLGLVIKVEEEKGKEKIDFKKIYGGDQYGEAMEKIFIGLWNLTSIGSHTGRSKITKRADIEFIITTIYLMLRSIIENVSLET
jgi:hypothetical protein